MPHEVVIENATFIVNSFSSEDATEPLDKLLERVIIKNAEQELRSRPLTVSEESGQMS